MRSTKYEKLFANYLSDKWLVSKTYQECIQLNSKNHSVYPSIQKWVKELNKDFFQRRRYTDGQQIRQGHNVINHQGNTIKTAVRCHLTSVKVTITIKTRCNKCQWGCWEKGIHGFLRRSLELGFHFLIINTLNFSYLPN